MPKNGSHRGGIVLSAALYVLGTAMLSSAILLIPHMYASAQCSRSCTEPTPDDELDEARFDIAVDAFDASLPSRNDELPLEGPAQDADVQAHKPADEEAPETSERRNFTVTFRGSTVELDEGGEKTVAEIARTLAAEKALLARLVGVMEHPKQRRRAKYAARKVRVYIAAHGPSGKRMFTSTEVDPGIEKLAVQVELFKRPR